ncbi:hypothetical protein D8M04_00635 [Oceanobacillus piezotolerans]|uniref:Uncharacterized protein n=1 Tax=Oceanobacillus piezotolerans TaxID=2448030 RepID=A0A498DA29_9BACI|nr:hypothetical protein [Oceanobacillus piezotolerans]RLL47821.1 hypothetical protein D8M04_00635 [Oceanobacillus piezotolerans]
MTAEVVIMNKKGLSLAADSAITSGADGVQKVYHSANKLFSLTKEHPVGIMVYGAASFMEVPWEVIIKSFRDHLRNRKFADLADYGKEFMDFISKDERFKNEELESIIVYRVFSDYFKNLIRDVEQIIGENKDAGQVVNNEKVTEWLVQRVNNSIADFKQENHSLLEIDYQSFKVKFADIVTEVKEEFIPYDFPEEAEECLHELAFQCVTKDCFSNGSTGLVITGYGDKEIFPVLINYRLEGFVFGELKYKKLIERKIGYTPDIEDGVACITAFAQKEMVHSFMGGVEPNMEDAIFTIMDQVLSRYPEQIQKHLNINFTDKQVQELKKLGIEMYRSIEDAVDEYKQNNYIKPLLGIVRSLPIEELAKMTEALINLTSFKRKVTRATESVGPPIDVAVITKGDGFVWIKRKNLVDSELNARL